MDSGEEMSDGRVVEREIFEFLKKHHLEKLGLEEIPLEEPLFERGILDSLGVLDLLAFLETRFRIRFGSEDLTWDNLACVRKITETVLRLEQARVSAR